MPIHPQSANAPQGILSLRDDLREIDGVVFDEESYARHQSAPAPADAGTGRPSDSAPAAPAEPQPAFPTMQQPADPAKATIVYWSEPIHTGWYEEHERIPYPIMQRYIAYACVSRPGSGSYITSMTSFRMSSGSFLTSWFFRTSGSFASSGSGMIFAGGYGLELI